MIHQEQIEIGGKQFLHTYADHKIRQIETGIVYDDAMDIVPCAFTYEETQQEREAWEAENETIE